MINKQPAVRSENRWRTHSYLQYLPRLNGTGQAMMGTKFSQMIDFIDIHIQSTIRYPDAFLIDIHRPGSLVRLFYSFVCLGSRKKRTMKQGDPFIAKRIGNRYGKDTAILVINSLEGNVMIWSKSGKPKSLPMEQIC